MAPIPVFLPRNIPWTEEPGGLQSMTGKNWTWFSDWAHTHTRLKVHPADIGHVAHGQHDRFMTDDGFLSPSMSHLLSFCWDHRVGPVYEHFYLLSASQIIHNLTHTHTHTHTHTQMRKKNKSWKPFPTDAESSSKCHNPQHWVNLCSKKQSVLQCRWFSIMTKRSFFKPWGSVFLLKSVIKGWNLSYLGSATLKTLKCVAVCEIEIKPIAVFWVELETKSAQPSNNWRCYNNSKRACWAGGMLIASFKGDVVSHDA